MHISQTNRWCIFVLLIAIGVLLSQGLMLGSWLVDDAGISIAYARNLLNSGELTAQVGAERVEGFSNPLWVFLLTGVVFLGPPELLIKFFAGVLILGSMLRLFWGLRRVELPDSVIFATILFLVFQPAIMIWAFSGLENSLYLIAGVELLIRVCIVACGKATRKDSIMAGIATSALVLIRPDGVMYIPLYFFSSLVSYRKGKQLPESLLSCLLPCIFLLGYSVFRWRYFGSLLPNTYFAKGGPTLRCVAEILTLDQYTISQLLTLSSTVFGENLKTWGFLFSVSIIIFQLWKRQQSGVLIASILFILTATATYLLIPGDWMPEARYATLFFPAFYLLMVTSIKQIAPDKWLKIICVLIIICGIFSYVRINHFSRYPTISINEVKERSDQFAKWGRMLGQSRCSILTADAGGILLRNELDFIDLGMLCDREIALALGEGSSEKDLKRFHDYIFNQRKPAFIATRAYHAWIAQLENDNRFHRDYVPIREYQDLWVKKKYGELIHAGDFVRNDVVANQYVTLEKIRQEAATLAYPFCAN